MQTFREMINRPRVPRFKFQNEYFLDYFPISVQENLVYVSIYMVNVVLDLKCIILKYMLV